MSEKNFNTRIKNKRDTSANWTANNPVLLNGELIIVDTADGAVRTKIGDGVKTYTQLPFADEALRSLIAATYVTKAELQELLQTLNLGFVGTEAEMETDYTETQALADELAAVLNGGS